MASAAAAAAATAAEQLVLPALLLIRRVDAPFAAALRQRFRVLDFFASGSPLLLAFLAPRLSRKPLAPRSSWWRPARVDADFLDALPSLRCVVRTAAGLDHIDLHECARRGVAVANSGRVYSAGGADRAHDLASESDVLVVACALNKTRHIVNKDVLDALGKDGIVINIGRGANVDAQGRQDRRRWSGRLFEDEPNNVPPELLAMDNVALTPHVAA